VKSITAKEMFVKYPQVKKHLWGGEFWKDGYYVGTVGDGQTEAIIMNYLEKQEDKEETKPITMKQLKLFF
jgi:putative transposase